MIHHTDLRQSPISYRDDIHEYSLPTGQTLSGVTSIIKAVLFPDKYSGIPEAVLRRACEHGTRIHALCQETDIFGSPLDTDCPREVAHYMALKEEQGIEMIASEYLVSDEETVATMIDCIDRNGNLYDIKTTRTLDRESLSWQLSFCAYLYELQNPAQQAGRLYGIWLRADRERAELVEVERKPIEELQQVLLAYREGRTLCQPTSQVATPSESPELVQVAHIEEEIASFKQAIDALEERKRAYLEEIRRDMAERGIKRVETPTLLVTLVEDSTSQTLDGKRLQADHPDLCAQYLKETKRRGYVKITLRS